MKFIYPFVLLLVIISCHPEDKSDFNQNALQQALYTLEMEESSVGEVIEKHKGQKLIIDIWASWCKDCIKSMPDIAKFQEHNPNVRWVFFSVDDTQEDWENGVAKYMDKYNIQGEQYFFNTGWSKDNDNQFIDYIDLDWIPRYMLLDEEGNIVVYYAKKITDKKITSQFKSN